DRAARLEAAVTFRRLDHGTSDAVLDRTAWILAFQLQEQPAHACVHARHLDQWSIAYEVEDLLRGHGGISWVIANRRRIGHPGCGDVPAGAGASVTRPPVRRAGRPCRVVIMPARGR